MKRILQKKIFEEFEELADEMDSKSKFGDQLKNFTII